MDDKLVASVTSTDAVPGLVEKASHISAQVESVMAQASLQIHNNKLEEMHEQKSSTDPTKLAPTSGDVLLCPSIVIQDADRYSDDDGDGMLTDLLRIQRQRSLLEEPGYLQDSADGGRSTQFLALPTPDPVNLKVASGLRGKKRFRAIVRKIITNLWWTRTVQIKMETESCDQFVVQGEAGKKDEQLVFNLNAFRSVNRSRGGLSSRAKTILQQLPHERSKDDLVFLKDVVDRLKCFSKYPRGVKQELARIIFYECFESGRIIIKQGHLGMSFYFVVTGCVTVKVSTVDKNTGITHSAVLGELGEGSAFGELALLHNIKRTATIICKDDSEFLRVDKDDFEAVLRTCYEREWNERLHSLSWIPQTCFWSSEELIACNNSSRMKEYLPGTVICGDIINTPDYVSFIISGQCQLVRRIYLIHELGSYGADVRYYLPQEGCSYPHTRTHLGRTSTLEKVEHFWNIGILTRGYYFGTGEDLKDTYIMCKTRVDVLEVPRSQFFRTNHLSVLEKMRVDLNSAIPTNKRLFRIYFQELRWSGYKDSIVNEVISKRSIPNNTTTCDIPYAIRTDCLRLGQTLPEPEPVDKN